MKDILLEKLFELPRWTYAIGKGIDKDIRRDQLYQLAKPEVRMAMCQAIKDGKYQISPPHAALIPKDTTGEFRTVYANEPVDRVLLGIINDLLFELCPEMVHERCKSYQKGMGCGKIVQEVSMKVCQTKQRGSIGIKADLSKYFDSVPIRYIDAVFDAVEKKLGKSAVIDVIRAYYHSDLYFDENGVITESFKSLKQGCAVAAFLADVILYHIDEQMSSLGGFYIRYSDDILYIGDNYIDAYNCLASELERMEMKLNPKKVETLSKDRYFKFLGYSIRGASITLSSTRIKTFQREIEKRTFKRKDNTFTKAVNSVNNYLYKGNGEFSWATQILPICNVKEDIDTLNAFVMDCLRAVQTGKHRLGGLGYVPNSKKNGCISRGTGRNVKANRNKTEKEIPGYYTIGCMQKAILTRKSVYCTLVATL